MSFVAKFFNDAEKDVNPVWVITAALVAAVIGWGSYVAYHTHLMPDLHGAAELLGGTGLANLAHKAADIADKFHKDPVPAFVPPPMAPPQ